MGIESIGRLTVCAALLIRISRRSYFLLYKIAKISTLGMCRNQSMNFQVVSQSMKSGSLENAMLNPRSVVAITVAPPRKSIKVM
jgi:hypothetical protein